MAKLAAAMGIEKPHLELDTGFDKAGIKKKIKALKAEVTTAIEAKDRTLTSEKRRKVRRLKRKIRRHMHLTH